MTITKTVKVVLHFCAVIREPSVAALVSVALASLTWVQFPNTLIFMVEDILKCSRIRLSAVIYVICAVALINGLLASAMTLAQDHGNVQMAGRIFALALVLRLLGLGLLFALVGMGLNLEAALRVFLFGYASGMFTAIVSGFCLFYYAVITHNNVTILTTDFFPFGQVVFAGIVTGSALLCLKGICWLLNFTRHSQRSD